MRQPTACIEGVLIPYRLFDRFGISQTLMNEIQRTLATVGLSITQDLIDIVTGKIRCSRTERYRASQEDIDIIDFYSDL